MKKWIAVFVLVLLAQGAALAAERGTPEYEKLKEYKKAQREKKATGAPEPESHLKGFWRREAERSGFAGTGAMFSSAITNAIPLDKPNSRK